MDTKIKSVHARQIMDCKFRPVVEVDVVLNCGIKGVGAAPTGSSVGMHEAHVLRDNDPAHFLGMSVFKAIDNVNNIIAPAVTGMDVEDLKAIDDKMIALDGTSTKEKLGGNAIYSVSIACAQAAAAARNQSFYEYIAGGKKIKTYPLPTANSIIGGFFPDMTNCFQEYTFAPYKAKDIHEAMEIIFNVHRTIGEVMSEQLGRPASIANGHGWKPLSEDPFETMDILVEAVDRCGYKDKVAYVLDMASSEMYDEKTGTYYMNGKQLTRDEQIALGKSFSEKYPFLFIEDVLDENDWEGYVTARKEITKTILIGDDLTVTSIELLKKAKEMNGVEGFIFKPNQVGTITESIEARRFAAENGMITIPSQRGGGTIWDIVTDMGIGLEVEACKSCAPRGGESVFAMNCIYRAAQENPDAVMFDFSKLARF